MSLILSGTDGLSDVDGSASTPAIRGTDANTGIFFGADIIGFAEGGAEVARFNADAQFVAAAGTALLPVITTTGDENTGIFFPAADTIAFAEGGAEAMRINSSGNVGIGTNSPSAFGGFKTLAIGGDSGSSTSGVLQFINNGTEGLRIVEGSTAVEIIENKNIAMLFGTNATERMRIDSSGNVQIGTTSNPQSTRLTLKYGTSANWAVGPTNNSSVFFVMNDGATGVQLTSGNQSWAAQSDERVKEDLVPIEDGLAKVATLRSVIGKLKKDLTGRRLPFLIAQDVQAVLPEAVDIGEDEDATLSLRYSDVIPLLVASIKELKAINDTQAETINALTARIVALETP